MNRQELIDELIREHNWSKETFNLWDKAGFHCAYCGRSFLQSLDAFKQGQTDHLLPQTKYPKLVEAPSNHVLACDVCNKLKRNWDPKILPPDRETISPEDRKKLLALAIQHVQQERIKREKKFLTEKELITAWLAKGRPE